MVSIKRTLFFSTVTLLKNTVRTPHQLKRHHLWVTKNLFSRVTHFRVHISKQNVDTHVVPFLLSCKDFLD